MKDMNSLSGKIIIVTGGCGHIGSKLCHEVSKYGGKPIIIDRKKMLNDSQIDKYDMFGCDLEEEEQIEEIVKQITDKYKRIDGIVNNAAFVGTDDLTGWNTAFEKQSLETWDRCMNVNLRAIFKIIQCAEKGLRASEGIASIINIGSIYGMVGPQWRIYDGTEMGNPAAYAVSKGGLIQMSRWLATTLAPKIRTNTISAGGIYRGQREEFVKEYTMRTPMGRMGKEEDVVSCILFIVRYV